MLISSSRRQSRPNHPLPTRGCHAATEMNEIMVYSQRVDTFRSYMCQTTVLAYIAFGPLYVPRPFRQAVI